MSGPAWTARETAVLEALHRIGCTDEVIAHQLGCCARTVRRYREALGLPASWRVRYGTWRELPRPALDAIARAVENAA